MVFQLETLIYIYCTVKFECFFLIFSTFYDALRQLFKGLFLKYNILTYGLKIIQAQLNSFGC
jgi:hypothetical protein